MSVQGNVLYGVRLDNPKAIHQGLCKYSEAGNVKALTSLLSNKLVREEIDGKSDGWIALGRAIYYAKSEAALVLLRNGANPLCSIGGGASVTEYVGAKENMYSQKFTTPEFEALYIAIVANRILKHDAPTVCELLSTKCQAWSFFGVKKLLAEIELHDQDSKQDNTALAKSLIQIMLKVTADESIHNNTKEEFAAFCKQKSGVSMLENEKPAQVDLEVVLQTICSHLLISTSKKHFLNILGVDDSRGIQFIHEIEKKFAENFQSVFEMLFIEDPEETEMLILGNYSPLFSDFLQIYHYHVPAECKDRLQTILINVTEKVTKEPVAVSLTHRMHEMQREIVNLTATVEELQSKLAAQDEKMAKIMAVLNLK